MKPTRLNYDSNCIQKEIKQSVKPGQYSLYAPNNKFCYTSNPEIRYQHGGVDIANIININSDLKGLTRKLSNCSKYNPYNQPKYTRRFRNCKLPTEYTTLSNPPCTLKGTGWDRWDWLCKNPQKNVIPELNMQMNVNTRLRARDNYIPCISTILKNKK